jgi:tetratricopeptide (TPR) repeat protein
VLGTFHRKNLELALGFYKRLRASLEGRTVEGPKARAELAMTYHRMATISGRLSAHDEAREAFRAAIALREGLVRDEPGVVEHVRDLAGSYTESGVSLCNMGRSTEGLEAYRRAIELWEQLAHESSGTDGAVGLSRTLHHLGYYHIQARRTDEALKAFRRALEIREKLTRDHPEVPKYRAGLATTLRIMGGCYSLSGRPAEALEIYRRAQALLERQIEADPADLDSRSQLAVVINNMGIEQMEDGRADEALPLFRRYLAMHQELVKADPTNVHYRQMLAYAYSNVGMAQSKLTRFDEALQAHRDALALHQALALAYPGRPQFQDDLIRMHSLLADTHVATGRTPEARADLREAERILGQLPEPGLTTLSFLASSYSRLSAAVGADERQAYADQAMAILRRAVAAGWRGADHLHSHPSLDPLRSRADFQELEMDLSFPDDPFARSD